MVLAASDLDYRALVLEKYEAYQLQPHAISSKQCSVNAAWVAVPNFRSNAFVSR